jgi:hypothetical protein
MQKSRLPVVVTQYEKFDYTYACVEDLRRQEGVSIEIWLVDVASPSLTPAISAKLEKLVDHFIPLTENVGFGAANNIALKKIIERGEDAHIGILNNDTTFEPETWKKLVSFMYSHPKAGQVTPRLLYPNGKLQGVGGKLNVKLFEPSMIGNQEENTGYTEAREVVFASGCAILCSSEALKAAGLFDEDYYMYSEDVALSLTMQKNNYQVWYCPEAVIVHHESVASGSYSAFKAYYLTRSHVLLAKRTLSDSDYRKYLVATRSKLVRQSVKYATKPKYVASLWRGFTDGKHQITGRVAF